jgi:hypothetical protein
MKDKTNISKRQIVIKSCIDIAIEKFNNAEQYIIINDSYERCICACFARYLVDAIKNSCLDGYCVDVEYSRGYDGQDRGIKRINDAPITVDLILHKRGCDCNYDFDNLICIEMKKSTDRRGGEKDEERLDSMVGYDYGYQYQTGFMILINIKEYKREIKNSFYLPFS